MEYTCPHCNRRLSDNGSLAGQLVECPHCAGRMQLPPSLSIAPVIEAEVCDDAEQSLVSISDEGCVTASYRNVAEAKLAMKELRLIKRQLSLVKRQLNAQQKELRSDYTHYVRQRGSMIHGGGSLGRFIRSFQTLNRDSNRSQLAANLSPLEQQKRRIEAVASSVEKVQIQIEMYLLNR